jgi:trigger factor
MDITKKDIDALNAVLTVVIEKKDYQEKVDQVLTNYKKTANIPGFRKGHIPMGMVKKQFGQSVLVEEVNKLLQEKMNSYLTQEKLDILGNPLPKNETEIDWTSENFSFEFELGLAPEFTVDISKKATVNYKIEADKSMVDNQVKTIRKQYGKLISQTEVGKTDEVTGTFSSTEADLEHKTTFEVDVVKGKKQLTALVGAKVGDKVALSTKGLFAEDSLLARHLGLKPEEVKGMNVMVSFAIEEVNTREMAALDQEFFDKLFGEGVVTNEKELKAKIKEDAERQFEQQSDQKLLNDVIETLIAHTKFDLPSDFLKRWIQSTGEAKLTFDEAVAEYDRSEKGLRYQLIEGKLRETYPELQIKFEELNAFAHDMIKAQMAQYGHMSPTDQEVDGIVARIMSNEEEVRRLSEQLNTKKLLEFFKTNAKLKSKTISYDQFIKEAYA